MRKTAAALATLTLSFLLAPHARAQSLDDVVASVVKEYGGAAAWQKVTTIRQTGTVVPAMGSGNGAATRCASATEIMGRTMAKTSQARVWTR